MNNITNIGICVWLIFVGIGFPPQHAHADSNRVEATKSGLRFLQAALEELENDIGYYPSEQQGLAYLQENIGNDDSWKGPYLHPTADLIDRWGQSYRYILVADCERMAPCVYSVGPDGVDQQLGGDDIYLDSCDTEK